MGKHHPEIVGPPRPEHKMERIQQAVGKTIESIEYGTAKSDPEYVHENEVIVLHFTDGSALSITTGSNAYNLSAENVRFKPGDFHTDLMPFWED